MATMLTNLRLSIFLQEERSRKLDQLARMKKDLAKLDDELAAYGACDPETIDKTKRAITLGAEAMSRWTGLLVVSLAILTTLTVHLR